MWHKPIHSYTHSASILVRNAIAFRQGKGVHKSVFSSCSQRISTLVYRNSVYATDVSLQNLVQFVFRIKEKHFSWIGTDRKIFVMNTDTWVCFTLSILISDSLSQFNIPSQHHLGAANNSGTALTTRKRQSSYPTCKWYTQKTLCDQWKNEKTSQGGETESTADYPPITAPNEGWFRPNFRMRIKVDISYSQKRNQNRFHDSTISVVWLIV